MIVDFALLVVAYIFEHHFPTSSEGSVTYLWSLIFLHKGPSYVYHLITVKGCIVFAVPLSTARGLHKRNRNSS